MNIKQKDSIYNEVAIDYDAMFSDIASIEENIKICSMLPKANRVLDIGCGTGMYLDYCLDTPERYTGIDPCGEMLEVFMGKHPDQQRNMLKLSFEEYSGGEFDLVISLFGSLNYVESRHLSKLPKLLAPDAQYFLMFFKPDYFPVTYEKVDAEFEHVRDGVEFIKGSSDFVGHKIIEFNNYLIVTNIAGLSSENP